MRNFGTDKPEFMTFTIDGSDKVHKMPLGTSMPFAFRLQYQAALAETDQMKQELMLEQFQHDYLVKYLGKKTVESLTMATVQGIFQAWLEESADNGATPGE